MHDLAVQAFGFHEGHGASLCLANVCCHVESHCFGGKVVMYLQTTVQATGCVSQEHREDNQQDY